MKNTIEQKIREHVKRVNEKLALRKSHNRLNADDYILGKKLPKVTHRDKSESKKLLELVLSYQKLS